MLFNAGQPFIMLTISYCEVCKQRLFFNFKRGDLRLQARKWFRYGIKAHPHSCTCGIQQVDGFIG